MRTTRAPLALLAAAVAVLGVLVAPPSAAERAGYTYLSYVGSDVALVSRNDDDTTASPNMPVVVGDRLVTGTSSRAEAVLADGAVLRVDVRTSLRFDALARTFESEDDRNVLYLERGALCLEVRTASPRENASRVDTDDATVVARDRALVRVDAGSRGTEVYVAEGQAEVTTRSGRTVLSPGETAFVGAGEFEVEESDFPRDRFTRFVAERRDRVQEGRGEGTQYVSSDYAYDYDVAAFDDYGSWVYVSSQGGYCWRPTVAADWRPYWYGYWRYTPHGMTWVSYEPWGWLPYHYGNWFLDASFGWCWGPGSYYSPAWVYWMYTPSWVGWCPIGYYGNYGHYGNGGYRGRYPGHGSRPGYPGYEGGHGYAHLAGRVDVRQVDPRGWSYVSSSRMGSRFESGAIVRGERLDTRGGSVGVVATAPLRISRGSGSVTGAVQDAVRRAAGGAGHEAGRGGSGPGAPNEGLTAVLRRDGSLSAAGQEELRRSEVRAGSDPGYRPADPGSVAAGRRGEAGDPSRGERPAGGGAVVGRSDRPIDGSPESRSEIDRWSTERRQGRENVGAPTAGESRGVRDSWRDSPPVKAGPRAEPEAPARREAERGAGAEARPPARGDDGWRSSAGRSSGEPRDADRPVRREDEKRSTGATSRPEARPSRTGEEWRTQPGTEIRREAPAPRSSDPPRSEPRRESPPSRSYDSPHSSTRSAPAPSAPRSEVRSSSGTSSAPQGGSYRSSSPSGGSSRSYSSSGGGSSRSSGSSGGGGSRSSGGRH